MWTKGISGKYYRTKLLKIHKLCDPKKYTFYFDCTNTKTAMHKSCDPKEDTFYVD